MATTTMTSWTRPADIADAVGDLGVACECVHCPPHRTDTLCQCDHPAGWLIWIAHAGGDRHGNVICGVAVALCDLCRRVALKWAEDYADGVGRHNDGNCFVCGASVRATSDVITAVVAL